MTNIYLKIFMKSLLSLSIWALVLVVINIMSPAISGSLAVDQLNDSYTSGVSLGVWVVLKKLSFLLLPLIIVTVFANDIYSLFIKKHY